MSTQRGGRLSYGYDAQPLSSGVQSRASPHAAAFALDPLSLPPPLLSSSPGIEVIDEQPAISTRTIDERMRRRLCSCNAERARTMSATSAQ
jgi:hypothetical protein